MGSLVPLESLGSNNRGIGLKKKADKGQKVLDLGRMPTQSSGYAILLVCHAPDTGRAHAAAQQ